jgi:hypothetical protein
MHLAKIQVYAKLLIVTNFYVYESKGLQTVSYRLRMKGLEPYHLELKQEAWGLLPPPLPETLRRRKK